MPQVPSSLCGDSLCRCSMAGPDASGCGEHGGEIPPTKGPGTPMSDHAHGLGELFQAEDADRVVEQAELDAGRARGMRSTDGVQLPVSVGAALNPGRMSRSGSRPATAPP